MKKKKAGIKVRLFSINEFMNFQIKRIKPLLILLYKNFSKTNYYLNEQ